MGVLAFLTDWVSAWHMRFVRDFRHMHCVELCGASDDIDVCYARTEWDSIPCDSGSSGRLPESPYRSLLASIKARIYRGEPRGNHRHARFAGGIADEAFLLS